MPPAKSFQLVNRDVLDPKRRAMLAFAEITLRLQRLPVSGSRDRRIQVMRRQGPATFTELYQLAVAEEWRVPLSVLWETLEHDHMFARNVFSCPKRISQEMFKMLDSALPLAMYHRRREVESGAVAVCTLTFDHLDLEDLITGFKNMSDEFPEIFEQGPAKTAHFVIEYTDAAFEIWRNMRFAIPKPHLAELEQKFSNIYPQSNDAVDLDSDRRRRRRRAPEETDSRMTAKRAKIHSSQSHRHNDMRSEALLHTHDAQGVAETPPPGTDPERLEYGMLSLSSSFKLRSCWPRPNERLPPDFSFGKSADEAREACVFLYLHVVRARNEIRPDMDAYCRAEPCPQWRVRHPRLPMYPVRLVETDTCVACTQVFDQYHAGAMDAFMARHRRDGADLFRVFQNTPRLARLPPVLDTEDAKHGPSDESDHSDVEMPHSDIPRSLLSPTASGRLGLPMSLESSRLRLPSAAASRRELHIDLDKPVLVPKEYAVKEMPAPAGGAAAGAAGAPPAAAGAAVGAAGAAGSEGVATALATQLRMALDAASSSLAVGDSVSFRLLPSNE